MVSALVANYTQTEVLKKGLLYLAIIPLFFLSYFLLNLVILGLMWARQFENAQAVYFDFYEVLRFLLVFGGLFVFGKFLKNIRVSRSPGDSFLLR